MSYIIEKNPESDDSHADTQVEKRNVIIDLKSAQGRLEFGALLEEADVLLDGYRPGLMGPLGFGREIVHEIARRRGRGLCARGRTRMDGAGSDRIVVGIS